MISGFIMLMIKLNRLKKNCSDASLAIRLSRLKSEATLLKQPLAIFKNADC